jgi:hypothetical protein
VAPTRSSTQLLFREKLGTCVLLTVVVVEIVFDSCGLDYHQLIALLLQFANFCIAIPHQTVLARRQLR